MREWYQRQGTISPLPLIPSRFRRPKLLIALFAATVLLAVAALVRTDLQWHRQDTMATAEERASSLTLVLSAYVRGSFAATDASLRHMALHSRRVGGVNAANAEWDETLAAARAALPGIGSFTVTDAHGIILHSTVRAIVGQSRASEYVYQRLKTLDRDELVVSTPFPSVAEPKRYLIPVGRRLVKPDGTFDGTVVATVVPDSFREFFKTVGLGGGGIVWVFHPSGTVLFAEPSPKDPMGSAAGGNPVLEAAKARPAGVIHASPEPNGAPAISAYRQIETPPLVVAVTLDRDEVLQVWHDRRRTALIAFALLTVTVFGLMFGLFRQIDVRTAAEQKAKNQLQAALEQEQRARREIEAASTLKDEFPMTLSHELRTPLTAIYGWVRMLEKNALSTDQRARAIEAIDRNARAQARLIDDLLDVSRAISGKLRLDPQPCNIAGVAYAAAESLRPALDAKRIRFESTVDASMDPIVADADRLQQIIWNLLSNAIKFTAEGGTVQLRIERAASHVEIAVSDTGIGIDPDFLPHVFERFRQAETGSRRRFTGLGLGLAIARHLTELHGGTITAESEGTNKGATFRVMLPVQGSPRPVRRERAAPAASASADPAPARLDGIRVLVVDDEPDARHLFVSILQNAGADVVSAGSAAVAIRRLVEHDVQVLVSDIEMPGEDGYQLLQHATAERGRLISIAVTGYARPVDRERALRAGFDAHLAKPVEPAELVALIASLIRGVAAS